MKHKIFLFLSTLILVLCMVGCGKGEEKESTLTGMVISVDGTTVSLREMDSEMQQGNMPSMPNRENFNPEDFEGDFNPENFNTEDFEGDFNPENFNPEDFNGGDFNPEDFNREDFEGNFNPEDFNGTEFAEGESTTVDLVNAHISVEIEEGKASGSMEDIKKGSFLTITMNEKGEATNVLVSSQRGFGGRERTE